MKKFYWSLEGAFEKLVTATIAILGNSVTFILAFCLVVFWLSNRKFFTQDIHARIGDVILGITFLSFFIIQKSVNRFSGAIHIKLNELVAANDTASNRFINIEEKTEHEITELSKEYAELIEIAKGEEHRTRSDEV